VFYKFTINLLGTRADLSQEHFRFEAPSPSAGKSSVKKQGWTGAMRFAGSQPRFPGSSSVSPKFRRRAGTSVPAQESVRCQYKR
jgi:hypothetical protein